MLKITLVKSFTGYNKRQIATVHCLGLNKVNSCAIHGDSPQIRGMIRKLENIVSVEVLADAVEVAG